MAPVSTPDHPISGSMDDFDHTERNLSGFLKGSSHDTLLVPKDTPLSRMLAV